MKNKVSITLNAKTLTAVDSIVDGLYIRNRSQAVEHLVGKALGQQKTAVILAGGPARGQSIEGGYYRTTIPIKGVPLISRNLRKLKEAGFTNVYLIGEQQILTAVFTLVQEGTKFGVHLTYVEDRQAKGSMESLKAVRGKITTRCLIVYGDIYFAKVNVNALWNDHLVHNGAATLLLTTSPAKKGTVKMEGSKILEFIQHTEKSQEYLGFSSIFVAEPEVLEYSGKSIEQDVFPQLAKAGVLFGHVSSEREAHIHSMKDVRDIE